MWSINCYKPLSVIFKNCIDNGIFPDIQKKFNIIPVHKKGYKHINNYRPVSLLPMCNKIFEKLQFNSTFKFVDDNNPHKKINGCLTDIN